MPATPLVKTKGDTAQKSLAAKRHIFSGLYTFDYLSSIFLLLNLSKSKELGGREIPQFLHSVSLVDSIVTQTFLFKKMMFNPYASLCLHVYQSTQQFWYNINQQSKIMSPCYKTLMQFSHGNLSRKPYLNDVFCKISCYIYNDLHYRS